ncbi:putative uncharacterized protein DDB_G0271606 isoform X2 [Phlebotomus papatasi]|uniref:putative uncharacterized protein DDB_G0271606 isoform X2 n=1 Tax=Phlebotomus papatasi TaxID=29031 RepID=UPI0024847340|nr:putative uncharacterized protein DDB_G0271606 isoform X2 [Phlebotomus papatasi]
MWISTIFIVALALGSLNPAASEEKIADEKTVAATEKVQEKRQISGHTKVPTHPKLSQDFTPLIYGNQVTPGLGQYAIPEDPSTYASSANARKLPNANNYLKLAQQGQLSPSVAPQQFHVELKGAQQQPVFVPQGPRVNTISDAEYLQLIQNAQKYQAAQPQPQHFAPFVPQHQGAILVNPAGQRHQQYAQLYQKPTTHPLSDSSLEREIEKLVAANSPQQTASSQRQSTKVPKARQFLPKNQHNFVFIPYQPHALQQFVPQQYAAAAIPQQQTLKQPQQLFSADFQQASKFHQFLPQAHFIPLVPQQAHQAQQAQQVHQLQQAQQAHQQQQEHALASPIISYHQKAPPSPPQSAHNSQHSQYPTTKPAEVKAQPQQKTPDQKQPAHSTIYVSHSTSTPPFASPTKQSHYTAKPTSHSQETPAQAQHSQPAAQQVSINSLAASIFKTPPSQQRPLTQQEFQALVDAGYPVTPIHVPVPVPVPADKYEGLNQQPQQQNAAYALQQQQYSAAQAEHKFKYPTPQTAGSQYQPAILSPATFYAPQTPQGYYHREQRDAAKETKQP